MEYSQKAMKKYPKRENRLPHYSIRRAEGFPKDRFLFNPYGNGNVDSPLQIKFLGPSIWAEGVRCLRKNSPHASAELIRSGTFSCVRRGRTFLANAGDLLFLPPHEETEMICMSERAEKYVLAFSGTALDECLKMYRILPQTLFHPAPERWDASLGEAEEILRRNSREIRPLAAGFAFRMLETLGEMIPHTDLPEPLRYVLDIIRRNPERKLTLEQLCLESGMSRMSLYRLFRRYLNGTPMEYVRERRLSYAMELLQESGTSIKEIAGRLNYSSPQYFSSEFKHCFGYSPGRKPKRERSPNASHPFRPEIRAGSTRKGKPS